MEIRLINKTKHIRLRPFLKNTMRIIVISFMFIILAGTLLLMLPWASKDHGVTPFSTAFMTAVSSTSVTGLLLKDTSIYWSMFGQIVILVLIQIGGLGLVTITTFFNLAIRRRLGFSTMHLVQESVNTKTAHDASRLVKMIVFFTLCVEFAGACLLSVVFIPEYGIGNGIYNSVFMSVSAYCNAGIGILGGFHGQNSSMTMYFDNPFVLIVIGTMIIIGGLGFVVWHDIVSFRTTKRLILHTKLVLLFSAVLIIAGGIAILASEWNNPNTIGEFTVGQKILNAFFYSVNLRTTGFSTFSLENLNGFSKMFSVVLMFIGASPGSTGGGIKVTTFVVLLMTTFCVVRGKEDTMVMGRRISKQVVYKSLAVAFISFAACFVSAYILSFTAHINNMSVRPDDAFFETVSAFSTTGFSLGITSFNNTASQIMLVLLMFLGRVGPVSLALSLAAHPQNDKRHIPPEGIILVG